MLKLSLNGLLPTKKEIGLKDTIKKINDEKQNLLVVMSYQVEIIG